jgi:hypothetical protein
MQSLSKQILGISNRMYNRKNDETGEKRASLNSVLYEGAMALPEKDRTEENIRKMAYDNYLNGKVVEDGLIWDSEVSLPDLKSGDKYTAEEKLEILSDPQNFPPMVKAAGNGRYDADKDIYIYRKYGYEYHVSPYTRKIIKKIRIN